MALIIGVTINEKIRVGDRVLTVIDVPSGDVVSVRMNNGPSFLITNKEKTEIAPGVSVFCGVKDHEVQKLDPRNSRLAFEAPRSIKINRMEIGYADHE